MAPETREAVRKDLDRQDLERAVLGALRDAINAHGPITAQTLTSATKRIVGQVWGKAA